MATATLIETPTQEAAVKSDELEQLAVQLAEQHKHTRTDRSGPLLLKRLEQEAKLLQNAYEYFGKASRQDLNLSYAAEWILDNFYLVQQTVRQIGEDMPRHYYDQLPKLTATSLAGFPRIFAAAWAFIGYNASQFDIEQLKRFTQPYEQVAPLTMGELWALPTMLRIAALESLSHAIFHLAKTDISLDEDFFIAPIVDRRQLDDAIVANAMRSLRLLATQDWNDFFEDVSQVEAILRRDPANVYRAMDFETRNLYRTDVEELAAAAGRSEEEVAQKAIELAASKANIANGGRIAHVGYYLLDIGRRQVETEIGYRPSTVTRIQRWLLDHPTLLYLDSIVLVTVLIWFSLLGSVIGSGGTFVQTVIAAFLTFLPSTAIAVTVVNWLVTRTIPPCVLPRLDYEKGIPAQNRGIVIIPTLLTSLTDTDTLLEQLELHFLRNADPNLAFALLTDFTDAAHQHVPEDDELLGYVRVGIQRLNAKYRKRASGPFYLFHRERKWNASEDCWMGWERKRGKLAEFNRLLMGDKTTSYVVKVGDLGILPATRYVITLDSDTTLPQGGAARLIATLAHPLNRAEYDPETGERTGGYAILQPRIEIIPTSANRSPFSRIFAGDTGLDLYTRAVSDVYQDLFGEGIYVGKGIYDVAAFQRCLAGVVPPNSLLSHDLFEGLICRVALVTEEVLYEDYPFQYLVHMRRVHRWIRGDWQLLPWLMARVPREDGIFLPNPLSVIQYWKIVDNLRRSLVSPALLLLLVAGWLYLPGSALGWTALVFLVQGVPLLTQLIDSVFATQKQLLVDRIKLPSLSELLRWLLSVIFLPYEVLITLDAIGQTVYRLFVTHKRLLQWTTAAHTARLFGSESDLRSTWRQMLTALVFSGLVGLLVALVNSRDFPLAASVLVLWLASPEIAWRISRPQDTEATLITEVQHEQLRRLARRTWLYFEQFVGPEDHWLPPDHYQEDPPRGSAHHTSPTNIGLMLLSTLAAHDFGYIGRLELILRLHSTFESMNKLERHRGHLLNWYDTRSLEPLMPRYVSTVDNGNLAGCLLALKHGCTALEETPIMRSQRWLGLLDTISVLQELLENPALIALGGPFKTYLSQIRQEIEDVLYDSSKWAILLATLNGERWDRLSQLLLELIEGAAPNLSGDMLGTLRQYAERVRHHLTSMQRDMDLLLPLRLHLDESPALFTEAQVDPAILETWNAFLECIPANLPSLRDVMPVYEKVRTTLATLQDQLKAVENPSGQVQQAQAWCDRLTGSIMSARLAANNLLIGLRDLSAQAESQFQAMDFSFLFDPQRELFYLGFNVTNGRLDDNYYDLLASESRIASLVAIAKGDVPISHWLHLGRPVTETEGQQSLLSWSGTMFEYLMPDLLLRNYQNSLLSNSSSSAVMHHIVYGKEKNVPWGISESGYYAFDANMNYQYRAFGAPGLGFKRGLTDDLVIAPYASLLALRVQPLAVVQNIDQLTKLGLYGRYGFYESVDFTRSRLVLRQKYAVVRSYMVHHQGMILVGLLNFLQNNRMVERFHADPRIHSVELLLQERIPVNAPIEYPNPDEVTALPRLQTEAAAPWTVPVDTPLPQVHILSNGRYSVLVTNAGGGYSHWQDRALTRWHADTTLDGWGTWIYVQDQESDKLRSACYQPTAVAPDAQNVTFLPHQADFLRRDGEVSTRTQIVVSPDDDVEIRRITLTNHAEAVHHLRLTSYAEVVIGPQSSDERHQAFNKLFIESDYLPDVNALLFWRRPRSAQEAPIFMAHLLVVEGARPVTRSYEGGRLQFMGRGQSARNPSSLVGNHGRLSGTVGATLDPIMALGQDITLDALSSVRVAYITLAASSREEALALAQRYQDWSVIERAFDQARLQNEYELRQLDIKGRELETVEQLLAPLFYPYAGLRADPATLLANIKGQSGLWPYSISGDYPILLARIADQTETPLIRDLLRAHAFWRNRGLMIDLVILNMKDSGYAQELQDQINRLVSRADSNLWLNRRGGIFILSDGQLNDADRALLATTARVILDGAKGSLEQQLAHLFDQPAQLPAFTPSLSDAADAEPTPDLPRPADLQFDNGIGGFSPDGKEYVIYLAKDQQTPAPWSNVIANPDFGFTVTEAGSGYAWAQNSGENRLTPWRNDPVLDRPGEVVYLRDEETGRIWSPTPLPVREDEPYLIRHGAGYSTFEHNSHGLKQMLRLYVPPDAPLKIAHLRLENTWNHVRRVTVTYYAEWVLATNRSSAQQYVVPEFDGETHAILARNAYNAEFGERVAFLAPSKDQHGLTADRTEFLGRLGTLSRPAALTRIGLTGTLRAGLDPCAAIQLHLDLQPGQAEEVFFLIGQAANRQESLDLIRQYQNPNKVRAAWDAARATWDQILASVTVQTPDTAMNLMLNRWLLYQALSCRVWGRTALYQSSGAFGYRDQLQDAMSLTYARPDLAREHILRAASRQFEEGDVLHWWHPPSGRGIRTRISDDLLWLPYVTAHYINFTGDTSILNEKKSFVRGPLLKPDEDEHYAQFEDTSETYSLYEHCRRAIRKGSTAGAHGLPLFGTGDWNDGMNHVGVEGRGESVWNGWFLYAVLMAFAPQCEAMDDAQQADAYRQQAQTLSQALDANAWDVQWYRRGYYDDGTALGSSQNRECQIDSIAQSWAVISGAGNEVRARQAMTSVADRLIRREDQLILLFTPPFDKTPRDPGYIKGYVPGIRENGGQYTHAALWSVWAFAQLGEGDWAVSLFSLLNAICHSNTPDNVARYMVEPYVVAADVYGVAPHTGRGGWTWYTGSASWMYRLGVEAILGLRLSANALQIDPCIPKDWPHFDLTYTLNGTRYEIHVDNSAGVNRGVKLVALDGNPIQDKSIPLVKDQRQHKVRVELGT